MIRNSPATTCRNAAMSGVPALRLSHPTNCGAFDVGCDKRANANAGTPIREFCEYTDMFRDGSFAEVIAEGMKLSFSAGLHRSQLNTQTHRLTQSLNSNSTQIDTGKLSRLQAPLLMTGLLELARFSKCSME